MALVRQTKELAVNGPSILSRILHDVMGGDPGQADTLAHQVSAAPRRKPDAVRRRGRLGRRASPC